MVYPLVCMIQDMRGVSYW